MRARRVLEIGISAGAVLMAGWVVLAQEKPARQDYERKVQEADIPKAALEALKKLADQAPITAFAEEVEHGNKYYEATWTGPHGKLDGLVTEAGAVVEIEEMLPADQVPAAARAEAEKEAGKDAKLAWEKKTIVMYEVHFKKDGKGRELIVLPNGRRYHEEAEQGGDEDDDD